MAVPPSLAHGPFDPKDDALLSHTAAHACSGTGNQRGMFKTGSAVHSVSPYEHTHEYLCRYKAQDCSAEEWELRTRKRTGPLLFFPSNTSCHFYRLPSCVLRPYICITIHIVFTGNGNKKLKIKGQREKWRKEWSRFLCSLRSFRICRTLKPVWLLFYKLPCTWSS